ncbi:MAG TPA: hypothetical protein VGK73_33310 [Polyangiaceae bacterium]
MSERVRCFMIEPTDQAEQSLRRYASGSKCPGPWGYHNASAAIGVVPYPPSEYSGDGKLGHDFEGDPRWPTHCVCGYEFVAGDERQDNRERLYRRPDTGESYTLNKAPAGAMWWADWYASFGFVGADGRTLCVMLPPARSAGDHWCVDGRANNSTEIPGWKRTGSAPDFSATPSIRTPHYHGFLVNGWLEPCGDSPN